MQDVPAIPDRNSSLTLAVPDNFLDEVPFKTRHLLSANPPVSQFLYMTTPRSGAHVVQALSPTKMLRVVFQDRGLNIVQLIVELNKWMPAGVTKHTTPARERLRNSQSGNAFVRGL